MLKIIKCGKLFWKTLAISQNLKYLCPTREKKESHKYRKQETERI